jgi:hypothetical protein
MDALREKLRNSDAVKALAAEHDVANTLGRLRWETVLGMYYTDPVSHKIREMDVSAKSVWSTRENREGGALCAVRLLVESKSASGFHVVFGPSAPDRGFYRLPEAWIGDEAVVNRLTAALVDVGVPLNDVKDFRSNLLFRLGESEFEQLQVDPPSAPNVATSFKETNTSIEKDLDSSVLWRASSALMSAVRAVQEDEVSARIEDICTRVSLDELYGYPPIPHVTEDLPPVLRYREAYHPIVVIDAQLWQYDGADLCPVEWCRFDQRGEAHYTRQWVDVVNRGYFSKFARRLTQHYNSAFRRLGAKRLGQQAA